jgi:hypothetical protein
VGYTLRGPTHAVSDEGQALAAVWPRLGRGQRVTLTHDLGDPRRSRLLASLYTGAAVAAHSTSYTTEHLRGRVVGRVSASSPEDMALVLDGARVRSDEMTLVIDEDA